MFYSAAFLFTLTSFASAHIQLLSPTPRGTSGEPDELGQLQGPCGGTSSSDGKTITPFATPSSSRTQASLKNFVISLTVADANADVMIYAQPGPNPTSFPTRIFMQSYRRPAVQNITLDFSNVPGMGNGPATLQITEKAADTGEQLKYVCADLTITGAPTTQSNTIGSAPGNGALTMSGSVIGSLALSVFLPLVL